MIFKKWSKQNIIIISSFLVLVIAMGALSFYYISKLKSNPLFDKIELANTPQKREYGLMNRTNLCDKCGMIFVFPVANTYSFWMKDTKIPLDIIFVKDDGVISNICYNMQPEDVTTSCMATSQVKYVIETNPSYFESNNLKENSKLDIKSLLDIAK
jgi:uncharacterized membrane protein (UPF0127 family)